MGINDVPRHPVSQQRLEQALGDKADRVQRRFEDVYYHEYPLREMLSELGYELLDHVAARSVHDPDLQDERTRLALTTAAESLFGVLELGCCTSMCARLYGQRAAKNRAARAIAEATAPAAETTG
ncbi:hypothetical protein BX281_0224 [Streptomyces sp. Ag82_O1-15]|uniref:hypothetical protein n=1 Tax=Streptomyces sp. Ag82_O1-15 TaxID=1938855 RepID=UPI000BB14878|nr:hypothetical protein [Streptomyces sp. Ag82_O1-15]PBC92552.1 hypothetical protein BX281_0224 [Streptomyces sp. Ag82_O1-15]